MRTAVGLTRQLLGMIVTLLLVSMIVFSLQLLIPGDPAVRLAGEAPTPEQIEAVRETLGLNDPFLYRYVEWLGGLVQGDMGTSLGTTASVGDLIAGRLPVSISLIFVTLLFALLIGVPAGVVAGMRHGSVMDRLVTGVSSLGLAVPNFWVAGVLITIFAISTRWLPANGYVPISDGLGQWFSHLILPAAALSLAFAAEIARQTRASLASVWRADYVRTARAKGLSGGSILFKHAGKNAAVPVATVIGIQLAQLIGGTVVIEQVFALPGIGQLVLQSVFNSDFPVVQGVVMVSAVAVLLVNFTVDVSYLYFNPKLRS
ncbi:ABC transporter permease [Geodermatophilus sp. URMC 63]